MKEKTEKIKKEQTDKQKEVVAYVYQEVKDMLEVMNDTYPEFNDRTLKQFIDDNQKRANSYVPTREEQNKEEWQANFFSKTTRNKVKALIAGVAKNPPNVSITAFDEKNRQAVAQAEVMKTMVEASYVSGDKNPQLEMFFDSWNCAINGTVIKYDGYLKIKDDVEIIKNYNPSTGEFEVETKNETIEDECIEINIPIQNFLIKDPFVRGVQDQSAVALIEYIDKDKLEFEYGDFKDFEKVKSGKDLVGSEEVETFFKAEWTERTKDEKYEVVKYYRKHGKNKGYKLIINGVLLLDAPLLWGRKKKVYPFPKAIYEPFASSSFFWGNSLPNILMGEQDVENAFVNSLTDEVYRSVTTPMLIGAVNKDYFDLEDENVSGDTRIYVEDVSQVTPMPVKGITQGDISMLNIIKSGMDNDSTDKVQGGSSGSGSTAREIVIANERAEELKGLFFIMMTDLWLQKNRLRVINVTMNYNTPMIEAIVGEDGAKQTEDIFKTFRLPDVELSNGKVGTKQIEVVEDQNKLSRPYELDVRETVMGMQGQPTEILQITRTFLDDYEYLVKIEADSLYQKSKALKMAMMEDKMKGYVTYFPQIFMANQNEFFKSYAEGYGDDPEKYLQNQQAQAPGPEQMMGQPQGQPGQSAMAPDTAGMGALPSL
ncbi:MAG: hypothetical protein ABIJ40_09470 [Bacteroidota bacterium]